MIWFGVGRVILNPPSIGKCERFCGSLRVTRPTSEFSNLHILELHRIVVTGEAEEPALPIAAGLRVFEDLLVDGRLAHIGVEDDRAVELHFYGRALDGHF